MTPQNMAPRFSHTWVCVCTYRRPQLLVELLDSLRDQTPEGEDGPPRLIVVDNSPEGETRELLAERWPEARWVHQPAPGLVAARNAALEAVPQDAEAVVFLDDDERARPGWLPALLDCARHSGADTVSGPVVSLFGEDAPAWIEDTGFIRRTDFPTGPWAHRPATNNVLLRAEWITEKGFRFDPTFNLIGGEDSEFFERMQRAGAASWWCAEAVVEEDVPADRLTRAWMRQRQLRAGHVRAAKHRLRGVPRIRTGLEGLGRLGYGMLRSGGRRLRRRPVRYVDSVYAREGLGMIQAVLGRTHQEYARPEDRGSGES